MAFGSVHVYLRTHGPNACADDKTDAMHCTPPPIVIRVSITWINKYGEKRITPGKIGMNLMRVAHQHDIEVQTLFYSTLQNRQQYKPPPYSDSS